MSDSTPSELQGLSSLVDDHAECLASGSQDLRSAALKAAKFVFDLSLECENASVPYINDFLTSLSPSEAPQTRSQARKRKRTPSPPPPPKSLFKATPLSSLYVDGMDEDQIWAQLDLRTKNMCEVLDLVLEGEPDNEEEEAPGASGAEQNEKLRAVMERLENGEEVDWDALEADGISMEQFMDEGDSEYDSEEEEEEGDDDSEGEGEEEEEAEGAEGIAELRDSSSEEEFEEEEEEEEEEEDEELPSIMLDAVRKRPQKSRKGKDAGLDDGFFDLAAFNAETEEAESRAVSSGRLDDEDESSDDEGSVDFFAPVEEEADFDEEDLDDGGEMFYKDFFEPPPKAKPLKKKPRVPPPPPSPSKAKTKAKGAVRFHDEVRVKEIKARGRNRPLSSMDMAGDDDDDDDEEDEDDFGEDDFMDEDEDGAEPPFGLDDDEEDDDAEEDDEGSEEGSDDAGTGRQTIERLKGDLFAEEDDEPQQDMTAHERRVAALNEQITTLEGENVGRKDWVLMGEADSRSRPQNSLLEEDLDFERVMKAIPVITEETVKGLEERIKARIMASEYDDVVRIRPQADKPFLPSRFFELKDTKSSQSLAQIYEDEYVAAGTDGATGDDRDGKLKKEHDDIENMWETICGKLDALCNAHFMPKEPKATISTVKNVSTTTLESALPTSKSATTMLAPEEVFAPLSSNPRARSEMTPAEKKALRGKERKAKQKTRDALDKSVDKYARMKRGDGVKKQKQVALESVVKSGKGVTVVGKQRKDILGSKKTKR